MLKLIEQWLTKIVEHLGLDSTWDTLDIEFTATELQDELDFGRD